MPHKARARRPRLSATRTPTRPPTLTRTTSLWNLPRSQAARVVQVLGSPASKAVPHSGHRSPSRPRSAYPQRRQHASDVPEGHARHRGSTRGLLIYRSLPVTYNSDARVPPSSAESRGNPPSGRRIHQSASIPDQSEHPVPLVPTLLPRPSWLRGSVPSSLRRFRFTTPGRVLCPAYGLRGIGTAAAAAPTRGRASRTVHDRTVSTVMIAVRISMIAASSHRQPKQKRLPRRPGRNGLLPLNDLHHAGDERGHEHEHARNPGTPRIRPLGGRPEQIRRANGQRDAGQKLIRDAQHAPTASSDRPGTAGIPSRST